MTPSEQTIVEQMRPEPCPFCGHDSHLNHVESYGWAGVVHCDWCGAIGPYPGLSGLTPPNGDAAWNTRVPALPVAVKDEATRLANMLDRYATRFDNLHRDIADDFRRSAELLRALSAGGVAPVGELEERARELLAQAVEDDGRIMLAKLIRSGQADDEDFLIEPSLRAIIAALRSVG